MSHSHLSNLHRGSLALLLAGLVAGGLAGCGGKTTTGPIQAVPLTLVAQGIGGSAHRYPAPAGALLGTTNSGATDTIPVTFTKALLVVRDVRLVLPGISAAEYDSEDVADTLNASGDDGGAEHGDDAGQIRFRGPFVVDLLSGHAARLDTLMVQPGDYARIQGHLRALQAGDAEAADYPGLVGATVWLEGTIDGDGGGAFSYLARIDDEFQIRGAFHVAEATPATAFISFDVSNWLLDRNGHFLDPRDGANDQAIKSAIRHSIKVGMDDNHDGSMDDRMHGEDGD